jgi:hypothetical protein
VAIQSARVASKDKQELIDLVWLRRIPKDPAEARDRQLCLGVHKYLRKSKVLVQLAPENLFQSRQIDWYGVKRTVDAVRTNAAEDRLTY